MPGLVLEDFLPYRLNRAAEVVSRELSQIYRGRFGLNRPEWRTLATLGQFQSLSASDIGRHSAMHKTKVSRAVAALEARRWLERTPVEADRRSELLELTPAGVAAYRALLPEVMAFERDLLASLGKQDAAALRQGLEALEGVLRLAARTAE